MPRFVNSWVASAMLRFGRYQVAEKRGERFLELAAQARSRIMEISPLEAVAAIRRGARVFDVREKEEFLRGHLPNAAHLGRGTLELEIEQRVPNVAAEIVVYCGGGNRSALSAENLQRMGYTNVKSIAGGLQAWIDADFPTLRISQPMED